MKRLRYISALVALIFTLLIFTAAAFEAAEYDHKCCGEGCGICAVLQMCENMLRLGASGGAAAAAAVIVIAAVSALAAEHTRITKASTLISLGVRLDN